MFSGGIEKQNWLEMDYRNKPYKIWFYKSSSELCSNEHLFQKSTVTEMPVSLPKIITVIPNLASINKYCLFKQFKDVYDRGTLIFHGITAKSSGITISFSRLSIITFLRSARLFRVYWMQPCWEINSTIFVDNCSYNFAVMTLG